MEINTESIINRERWRRYVKGQMTKMELAQLIADYAEVISRDEIDEKCYNTNVLFRGAMLLMLHDKRGHGKKRLLEDLDYLENILEAYESGLLTVEDMIGTVKEETGIDLVVERWKGEKDGRRPPKENMDNKRK